MSSTLEIKTHIESGRQYAVTENGEQIDVVTFISHIWKTDPRLVVAGMYDCYRLTPKQGEMVQ